MEVYRIVNSCCCEGPQAAAAAQYYIFWVGAQQCHRNPSHSFDGNIPSRAVAGLESRKISLNAQAKFHLRNPPNYLIDRCLLIAINHVILNASYLIQFSHFVVVLFCFLFTCAISSWAPPRTAVLHMRALTPATQRIRL